MEHKLPILFFQRIVSRTSNLLKDLDVLKEDTTSAYVEVEHCIQNLNLISTKQFMEKRVYDEEIAEKTEDTPSQIQPTGSINFLLKIKEALREGLPVIKSQVSNFEDGMNGNPSANLSKITNNNYMFRSLPYLLGTEEFIDSPNVGVAEVHQPRPESSPSLQQTSLPSNSTLSSVQSSPSLRSNLHVPLPPEDTVASNSEVSISDAGAEVQTREIKETINKMSSFGNLQNELAAQLRISNIANEKPTLPSEKDSVRNEPQQHENEEAYPHRTTVTTQVKSETKSKEVFQPPKKRNLFDDSSSDSEGELFKPNTPKVAAPPSSVFSPPAPKLFPPSSTSNPQLFIGNTTDPKITKSKGGNLFGSSDSEDDLFSGITSNDVAVKPDVKSTMKPITNLNQDEANIFSSKNKINSQSVPTNKSSTVGGEESNKSQSIFEDEPDFIKKDLEAPTNTGETSVRMPGNKLLVSNSQINQTRPALSTQPKQRNLFADSDSDEDLFSSILVKNKGPTAELNKPPSTSPLPDNSATHASRYQSTPIQNGDRRLEKVHNPRPPPSSDSASISVNVDRNPIPKLKASLLFDDDSDDEDLFGGVSSAKYPLPSSNVRSVKILDADYLFNTASTTETVTQERIHAGIEISDENDWSSKTAKSSAFSKTLSITEKPVNVDEVSGIKETHESETVPTKPAPLKKVVTANDLNKDATSRRAESHVSKVPETTPVAVSEDDDLFKNIPSTSHYQPKREKIPVLSAFEDSDDEDLFSGSDKRPLLLPPLQMPHPSLKPEEGMKNDDPFGIVTEQKQFPASEKGSSFPEKSDVKVTEDEDLFDHTDEVKQEDKFIGRMEQKAPKIFEKIETSNDEVKNNQSSEIEIKPNLGEQTTNRIASLKLSLAKQPGLLTGKPSEGEKTLSSTSVRKPFGGVSLFGPHILSPVKSNPPSPIKTDQTIIPRDMSDGTKENSGESSDLLDCLGKQRPKAPVNRRPPSRVFRRSQFPDHEIVASTVMLLLK